jgi:putative transposase
LFGSVINGVTVANACGAIVQQVWRELPEHFVDLDLDAFTLMPNHIHGVLSWPVDAAHHLSAIMGSFKTWSARLINRHCATPGHALWQRGFYEHIIRNDSDLDRIRKYIEDNPARWDLDPENPERARHERPGGPPQQHG